MAMVNEDGSIVLSLKISTQKAFENFKGKIAQIAKQKNGLSILVEESKRLQTQLKQLEQEYALLLAQERKLGNDPTLARKILEWEGRIKRTNVMLREAQAAARALGAKATTSFARMTQGLANFGKRIAGIVKSALIFSVLYRVMQGVVKLFKNILMSDEEFRQDWEELKAAFYTAAYPIINLLVPAVKFMVRQVRDWAVSLGQVVAAIKGISYSELVDQAKASKEAADNYADMEKSSKKTAENVKKQLASFDDIEILSSNNKEEDGGEKHGAFESLKEYDTSREEFMLAKIMKAAGGALVAIGVILLLFGQIGWGIGFIIAGAALFGVGKLASSPQGLGIDVQNALTTALLIVGVAAIVIGIILCMCHKYVKGIALIALGAATVVGDIVVNWDSIKEMLSNEKVATWVAIGGVVAIVLGILLCFAHQWWTGIGLIALGATALGVDVAVNWDSIMEALSDKKTAKWIALGGVLAIALGILLCVAQMWALGIGLIVVGASALVAPIVVNWDAIWEKITKTFNSIIEWVKNNAMLIIGIILTFGGWLVLGIPLIVESIKAKRSGEEPSWGMLLEKIKEVWRQIKDFWNKNIAPVFTREFWENLARKCGNGLIGGFESAINGVISMFERMINWIVDGLNSISFEVPDWVPGIGGGRFGFNIPRVSFGRVSIPRLAQGAVIPPNREFLAILGDQKQGVNIEAPLQTIVDAFNIALAQNGGNYGKTEVVLEIDGREFGRAVVEQGDRENRRIGTRLVIA